MVNLYFAVAGGGDWRPDPLLVTTRAASVSPAGPGSSRRGQSLSISPDRPSAGLWAQRELRVNKVTGEFLFCSE